MTHVLNLSEAIAVLRHQTTFEVVLLELRLPDGPGVECVVAVRAKAHDVPIVVLTGLDDDDLAMSCIAAGAQDYLSKGTSWCHAFTDTVRLERIGCFVCQPRIKRFPK